MNEYGESITGPLQSNYSQITKRSDKARSHCHMLQLRVSGNENREFHKHPLKSSNIQRKMVNIVIISIYLLSNASDCVFDACLVHAFTFRL